jgi:hypothetical protein
VRHIFARRPGLKENGLPHYRFGAELSVRPGLRIPDVGWGCSLEDLLTTTARVVMLVVKRHSNDNFERICRDSTDAHWGATRRPMTPGRWSELGGAERAERVEIHCAVHWPENDTDRPALCRSGSVVEPNESTDADQSTARQVARRQRSRPISWSTRGASAGYWRAPASPLQSENGARIPNRSRQDAGHE